MFKNYLKVAARNLLKQKSYSFINVLGLAVGIAASVLISLYVLDELSYDKFHDKADRTFRITADCSNKGDSEIHQLGTPAILSKTLRDKYPQVETVTQINGPILDCTLKAGEKAFKEAEAYLAEPSFFQVFSFTLIEGDPTTSLREPNTVVLAQSVAAKLFGAENPMGRKIQLYAGDLAAMANGVVTVSSQVLRAAYANPVDSLRYGLFQVFGAKPTRNASSPGKLCVKRSFSPGRS